MTLRDDLVALYARNQVRTIEADPDFIELCSRHVQNPVFNAERHIVEKAKKRLETLLENPESETHQVRAAIHELLRWRHDEKRAVYHALIVAAYRGHWEPARQKYFDRAWQRMQLKYDFFLSFTTRYPPVEGDNPANTKYELFIRWALTSERYDTADRKRENLLALSIHRLLSSAERRGFFFPHVAQNNENVDAKLTEACKESVVFVQLIENIQFTKPDNNRENYCHLEYNTARQAVAADPDLKDRIVFVVAEDERAALIRKFDVHADYEDWYDHVNTNDPPYLPKFAKRDPTHVETLESIVVKHVRPKVQQVWEAVLDGVPV